MLYIPLVQTEFLVMASLIPRPYPKMPPWSNRSYRMYFSSIYAIVVVTDDDRQSDRILRMQCVASS